jgi:hypothetical protein
LKTISSGLALVAVAGLTACVTVPSGPSVMVLPGSHKTFEQFQADGYSCQAYAQQTVGLPPGQVATDVATTNAVAGTLIGAAAGAAIGSVTGRAGPGAAIGAGTGLLLGSAAGSNAYGATYYGVQRRYDQAYLQCMYAKGNQVPVRSDYRRGPPGYAPPPVYGPPAG